MKSQRSLTMISPWCHTVRFVWYHCDVTSWLGDGITSTGYSVLVLLSCVLGKGNSLWRLSTTSRAVYLFYPAHASLVQQCPVLSECDDMLAGGGSTRCGPQIDERGAVCVSLCQPQLWYTHWVYVATEIAVSQPSNWIYYGQLIALDLMKWRQAKW